MGYMTGKINLTKLDFVTIQKKKNKAGEEMDCLVIPIKMNNLFYSEKKNVFLDLNIRENKEDKKEQFGDYQISQSVGKEKYNEMKKEKKYPPSLGRIDVKEPAAANEQEPTIQPEGDDDLPF